MIHRRGVVPVLLLLALVLVGFAVQAVRGPAAGTPAGQAAPSASPAPTPDARAARPVLRSLAAVQRAYDAGDVRRLCRPGALVDAAVIRTENRQPQGCEAELEDLMTNVPRLRLGVRKVVLRPDLATVTVTTAGGSAAAVDVVRRGSRWLLSFSDGEDPLPSLAGTT